MSSRADFALRHFGAALAAAPALVALERTGVDRALSDLFYDAAAAGFPLRYHHLFEVLTHQWARYLVVLVAATVIAACLLSWLLPALAGRRRVLLFLALGMVLAPATVSLLKSGSPRHCPYDLVEYGGHAAYLGLFESPPQGQIPGRCFPGGHASAGFALLAFYFAGQAVGSRRLALAGLWGGTVAGLAFGLARVAQGAHFLSHNLWSGWVCWVVLVALYLVVIGPAPQARSATGSRAGGAGAGLSPRDRTARAAPSTSAAD
jgi:membrane-associated PAP2 superfamily phosphatase